MKTAFVLVCFVCAASAHICMLSPHQRGSMEDINKKEANDCGLMTKPCGGRDVKKPAIEIKAGANFTVTFQKNLNHYTSFGNGTYTNGYFDISFWTSTECHILGKVDDADTPSLTLYTETVTMLAGPVGVPAILQVTYVTNNPEVPAGGIFYQCADIELF